MKWGHNYRGEKKTEAIWCWGKTAIQGVTAIPGFRHGGGISRTGKCVQELKECGGPVQPNGTRFPHERPFGDLKKNTQTVWRDQKKGKGGPGVLINSKTVGMGSAKIGEKKTLRRNEWKIPPQDEKQKSTSGRPGVQHRTGYKPGLEAGGVADPGAQQCQRNIPPRNKVFLSAKNSSMFEEKGELYWEQEGPNLGNGPVSSTKLW